MECAIVTVSLAVTGLLSGLALGYNLRHPDAEFALKYATEHRDEILALLKQLRDPTMEIVDGINQARQNKN